MSNRAEFVKKLQAEAALKATEVAVKKREAKARSAAFSQEVVVHKKRKCNCNKSH